MKQKKIKDIKKTGFKVPKDYFENFNTTFFKNLEEENTMSFPKNSGFKVPDGYFNTIETSLIKKIKQDHQPKISTLNKKRWYYLTGIAASLLICFSIFWKSPTENQSITVKMVQLHFENTDLNTYELTELLSETNFLDPNIQLINDDYNTTVIEDYLTKNSNIETILLQ